MTYVSALFVRAELGNVSRSTTERKKMSTKTSFKRIALVAVAALGMGVLTSVSPANAANADATAVSVSPIRVTGTTTQDSVPKGVLKFTTPNEIDISAIDVFTLTVTTAPSATAEVTIWGAADATKGTKDSLAAAPAAVNGFDETTDFLAADAAASDELAVGISVASLTAGTYAGTLVISDDDATSDVTVKWSFTTAGAPKSIKLSKATVGFPAVALNAGAFVGYDTVGVSLLDTNGVATQPSTGDSIVVSLADYTNIGLANDTTDAGADLTISSTDLADGSHTLYLGARLAVADSENVTLTPAGVLPGMGVVATSLTATSAAIGTSTAVVTAVSAPTSTAVIKAGATATAKTADTSVRTVSFSVGGWPAGSAYKVIATAVDGSGGGNLTATINDIAGLTKTIYGISTGAAVDVVVTLGGTVAATDHIDIDGNGDGDVTDASDMVVTLTAATYAVTLTSPAVTPSIAKTAAALVVSGKIADSYSTPVGGATVSVSGAQTLSAGTASNLTGAATSAADGTFSVTLAAANALTTSVALTVTATKTGITGGITQATATVNLNAAGGASALTVSLTGDEDSATTATQLPAVVVPYTGRATGVSDEIYTVSTAVNDGTLDSTDNCIEVTVDSTPRGQIVATGTAGVLFWDAACTTAATHDVVNGTSTKTVAATGAANLWVTSTKTGLNTFTVTSGSVSKTYKFYAYNVLTAASAGDAVRNITSAATATVGAGAITYLTVTPTDAFGNAVKSAVAAGGFTITAKSAAGVLLDGPAISRSYTTTDADGNIIVGIIAGSSEGAASVTITGTGAQLGAAVGAATGTTAGTNGLTASVASKTVAITVGTASSSLTLLINSLIKKINALSILVAKIQKKLGVK
jgi:hypothetical protein